MNGKRESFFWELRVTAVLIAASLLLYVIHFAWFRDLRHIWLWSFTSLAFLPISVLVVTLLINRLLTARDKAIRLDKLNMLIGLFFSNAGNELLLRFSEWDTEHQYLHDHFGAPERWERLQSKTALGILSKHRSSVTVDHKKLISLKEYLDTRMDFLMRLIENPHLLEHEPFTQLLRAVFHLSEELSCRDDIASAPGSDVQHLTGDIERAYALIIRNWVLYMIFLRREFPFMFALSVRTNPLNPSSSPVVVERDRSPNK